MSKRTLILGSGLLGLALLAGATRTATATDQTNIPSDSMHCYYHLYHCVYADDGYWSGCDPRYAQGWIPTSTASAICRVYHQS
jgi:hypothetical protein